MVWHTSWLFPPCTQSATLHDREIFFTRGRRRSRRRERIRSQYRPIVFANSLSIFIGAVPQLDLIGYLSFEYRRCHRDYTLRKKEETFRRVARIRTFPNESVLGPSKSLILFGRGRESERERDQRPFEHRNRVGRTERRNEERRKYQSRDLLENRFFCDRKV